MSTKKNAPSEGLPISKRDKSNEKDTYAYPKNTSDVATSGGDAEILGTIEKKDSIDEPFEIARNFQTPDDLFNYGKNSLQNLNSILLSTWINKESIFSSYEYLQGTWSPSGADFFSF